VDNEIIVEDYLSCLEVVRLGAVSGTDDYESVKKVFKAGSDDFEKKGIVFSGIAPESYIAVHELIKDAQTMDFLGNIPEELERRRILGAQFLKFCRVYPKKLRKQGNITFAILTKKDELVFPDLSNVLIPGVFVLREGQISSFLFRFDNRINLSGEYKHRILYQYR
jgi:hypothetical protein